MAEYIEREMAFNAILKLIPKVDDDGYCWVIRGDAAKAVDSIPAADVAPVKHGRWSESILRSPDGSWRIRGFSCSVCGGLCVGESRYCPNCGAKMDTQKEDTDG